MPRIVLVAMCESLWTAEGRIQGCMDIPVTDAGRDQMIACAKELARFPVDWVWHDGTSASESVARILAEPSKARLRTRQGLRNICLGLWQGELEEELDNRFPTARKRWKKEPLAIQPPEGETICSAYKRLVGEAKAVLKKHRGEETVAILTAPLAFALLRCFFEEADLDRFRDYMPEPATWVSFEIEQ